MDVIRSAATYLSHCNDSVGPFSGLLKDHTSYREDKDQDAYGQEQPFDEPVHDTYQPAVFPFARLVVQVRFGLYSHVDHDPDNEVCVA